MNGILEGRNSNVGANLATTENIRFGKVLRGDAGTSLLEFALVLPILLLLFLGVIEIGRYAEMSIQVASAARAGAQYGAQSLATAGDSLGIQTAALRDSQVVACGGQTVNCLNVFPPNQGQTYVLCGCSSTGDVPGSTCPASCTPPAQQLVYVQVNAQGIFQELFNYPGIPSPITVNGVAQMRVAQ